MANEDIHDVKDEADEQTEEQTSEPEVEIIDEAEDQKDEVNDEQASQYIQKLENEHEELKNRLARLQADYENFRRRTREESAAAAKYRSQNLAEQLLPVIDNFERALNVETENEEAASLLQGMEIVYRQLTDALQKEKVEEIKAEGQAFDPELHQAVMQVNEEDYDSNVVIEVLQKGYQLNDRVIRPAMVKVNA